MSANHIPDSDPIADSPPKRTNIDTAYAARGGYTSQGDSADELFNDYETVATLPVARPQISFNDLKAQMSSPPPHVTQPTQILETPIAKRAEASPVVQVAASSPPRSSPAPPRVPVGNSMAPPGTFFRRPVSATIPQPIDLDIDDPPVEHSSGDEASRSRSNIKPSIFSSGGRSRAEGGSTSSFKGFTSQFLYNSGTSGISRKRPIDDMASAYAGSHRRPQKVPRQTGPARAQPVQEELTIDDIPDAEIRQKIGWLQLVYPGKSIMSYRDALAARRGNYSDALAYMSEMDEKATVDLTNSDDELAGAGTAKPVRRVLPAKVTAKRAVQAPARTIQEKWSSTQAPSKVTPSKPVSAVPPSAVSPLSVHSETPPKPRRRLIKGRRRASSPEGSSVTLSAAPSVAPSTAPSPQPTSMNRSTVITIDSDEDSAIASASEAEGEVDDGAIETKVLNFFNTCTLKDLIDISTSTEEVAGAILAKRPFKNLDQVRAVTLDVPDVAPTKSAKTTKRRSTRRPAGDRIVDVCLEMLTGYEAVDELVNYCEKLGKPILATMKVWGSNVYGDSQSGGIELLSLEDGKSDTSSMRDSGIGTPSSSSPEDTDGDLRAYAKSNKRLFLKQPAIMAKDLVMKGYQIVGLNWLSLLWSKGLSCILADDMGLGKTCQVISFLSHLYETGVSGPHLIIVPGSTLENWLREFRNFSPNLVVEPYYGLQAERAQQRADIRDRLDNINVIVTTYDIAGKKDDNKFLRQEVKPVVCVYDEGHKLKNSETKTYQELMRIPAQFRLLITGTPLQNNLQELVSLLAFIMPDLFRQRQEDLACVFKHKAKTTDADHAALLSAQRIARAKSMITPFILRRKKNQVLKHLPAKHRRVEYCDLTGTQRVIYDDLMARQRQILEDRLAGRVNTEHANFMPDLRKAAIHPLLFRNLYTDDTVEKIAKAGFKDEKFRKDKEFKNLKNFGPEVIGYVMMEKSDFWIHRMCQKYPDYLSKFELKNQEWMDSGKVQKLVELLKAFRANGDRTLVFSQMTENGLDLLEAALDTIDMPYFRLDGSTPMAARQDMIDAFYKDESVPVFLLTTKAGGAGINLACANKVVIFDSSFNPQDDIQAENRAHRVGQTREVEVIRLISRETIEKQIYALGKSKLALDDRVAGEGVAEDEDAKKVEADGAAMVEKMLMEDLKKEKEGGDRKDEDAEIKSDA